MIVLTILIFALILVSAAAAIYGAASFLSLIFVGEVFGAFVVLGVAIAVVFLGFSMARHWTRYGRTLSPSFLNYEGAKSTKNPVREFFGF